MTPLFYPLILSGGAGSRLWPLSRANCPKQFLALGGEHAMIANTAQTMQDKSLFHPPTVISNAEHRFLVMDALEQVGCQPAAVLLEPCGRNTAAAIATGALHLLQADPDALVLAAPSDHVIRDNARFLQAIKQALPAALAGHIITFGAFASRPETGYGYIQKAGKLSVGEGVYAIKRFCEKPDAVTAKTYVDSGDYHWNMGIFFFKASALVEQMQQLCTQVVEGAKKALANARPDLGFLRLDPEAFAAIPSVSFDVAVMEKTTQGAVLPVDIGWSDIGSWSSLWEVLPKDAQGNATKNDAHFFHSHNSLAWSSAGVFTAVVGLDNVAVISTDDAVIVMDKSRAEDVRDVVEYLKTARRNEHILASKVYRPWGNYQNLDAGKGFLVKRMEVKSGAKLSLQYHHHRAEHWTVVEGVATVTRGNEVFDLEANASTYIAKGMTHRLENRQNVPLVLIEVQSGDYIDEEDIVRLEDTYGRV